MISENSGAVSPPSRAAVLPALEALLGPGRVRVDPDTLQRHGEDRATPGRGAPLAVAYPGSTEDVRALVRFARAHRLPLVPSGGRTGLCGGALAEHGELVVAMDRMERVLEFDPVDRTVRVEAGMVTARLQAFAAQQGLFYPVDFASAGSSQIGGNVATNAGGVRVIRHGMTRAQVAGLRVVDGRGEVLDLNRGLVKNNTGPDLRHLFIGSEGTLGIITEVTLQLRAPPGPSQLMLFSLPDFAAVLGLLQQFSDSLEISAFEFFSHNALQKVLFRTGGPMPLAEGDFYALVEFDRHHARDEERALALHEAASAAGRVLDAVAAGSLAQARSLWALRERISETLAAWTPWKNDISVRVSRMGDFIERADALLRTRHAGLEAVWYGHIGDGNIHLNVLKPESMPPPDFLARCAPMAHEMAALLAEFEGSISAEHGIGLLKRDYLHYTRSAAEIDALRALKAIFDPDGILNPGKLLPPD